MVGAAVGALVNFSTQMISNGGDFSKVNYSEVAVSAAAGAIGVGLAGNIATELRMTPRWITFLLFNLTCVHLITQ